ncbi:MAG: 50S ribosome-binding GTPase [Isosphaeraceae bacterium]|nr:50S ribosome-binding GTPase [Isosphaeraceae bacterium]
MARERDEPRTSACVLTPDGRGAISVVRLWGPGAVRIADAAFRPNRGGRLACSPPGHLRVGRLGAGLGDEVVAVVLSVDPPVAEIQTHGGPSAVALVLDALAALGAEVCSRARWLEAHSRTPLAAEAEADLARAGTLRGAEVLLDQVHGALDHELIELLGLIDPAPLEARVRLDGLLARGALGCRLVGGWRVALAGRPNVGKSRLLNAFAGYDRAIVDPTPGTTRDVLTVQTAVDGWPVELSDTAGLRMTPEGVEAAGIASARALHAEADLVLLVLDRSEPLTPTDLALMRSHGSALWVANKADLPAAWERVEKPICVVSAEQGAGIDALLEAIARRLVPDAPPPGAGVLFRPDHVRRLSEARDALDAGLPSEARDRIAALRGTGSEA